MNGQARTGWIVNPRGLIGPLEITPHGPKEVLLNSRRGCHGTLTKKQADRQFPPFVEARAKLRKTFVQDVENAKLSLKYATERLAKLDALTEEPAKTWEV